MHTEETQSCLDLIFVDMIVVMPGHFITHKYYKVLALIILTHFDPCSLAGHA